MRLLNVAGEVLRDPVGIVTRASRREAAAELVPSLLVVAIACAAVFGAVAGSYRGGVQIAYAAIKMPLVLLVPLVVALPATRALYRAAGVEVDGLRLAMGGLVAVTRTAVLAAGLAPVLWLGYSFGPDYHLSVVALAALLGLAGIPGLWTVAGTMPRRAPAAAMGAVLVLGLTTAQVGWLLRPFVARPTVSVSLVRPIEGDIGGTLLRSPLAALDIYLDYRPERSPWRDR